jgi:hypothetical protein
MALTTDSTGTKGTGSDRSGPVSPGMVSRVATLVTQGGAILAELDPDCLYGEDASALYAHFAGLERIAVAAKTLLAPRVETSGVWKEGGHKDAASHLAAIEGVSAGQARGTLLNGRRLGALPATEQAVREGRLSGPKMSELCGAAIIDPDRESELLDGAAEQPFAEVKERCQRSRATSARRDPMATQKRIRDARFFSWWTDADGAFCFKGRDTADRGARILNHLRHAADILEKEHRARMKQEAGANSATTTGSSAATASSGPRGDDGGRGTLTQRALWADAFFAVVTQQTMGGVPVPGSQQTSEYGATTETGTETTTGAATRSATTSVPDPAAAADADRTGSGTGSSGSAQPAGATASDTRPPPTADALSVITRPPDSTVVVLVDIEAWLRGRTEPGECCEIKGQGPIPVPMARDLANDSFLSVLFHQAGDIRAVSHLGRTINAKLRTALLYRDRTCVVPGCGVSSGLEIDHVKEFHLGGPTALDNLALLCHHHHQLKTYQGWTLTRLGVDETGRTRWRFEPEPPFGQEPGLGIDTDEGRAEWHREQRLE